MRVRLAPSPTGTLHIGTARTALFNWLFARHEDGQFLLRIEDTDKERSKPEFTENILEGLNWLGLNWDQEPILQSKRIQEHQSAIKALLNRGLAYRCYATEAELEEMRESQKKKGEAPRYDNRHRDLSPKEELKFKEEGRSAVVRFQIEDQRSITWNDLVRGPMHWQGRDLGGDMVISRRAPFDEIGDPLYNLVVVTDDAHMGITHVIRGEDHLSNTAKQILLYEALGLSIPTFAHTPLILNSEGRKLSKRDGVTSITQFRELGYTAEAMCNYMALLGWSVPEGMDEKFSIKEISKVFSFNRVNKSGAKFDWDKLNWLNGQVIHEFTTEDLFNQLKPLWIHQGWELPGPEWCFDLVELLKPSLNLLNDGIDQARPFFETPILQVDGQKQLGEDGALEVLRNLFNNLEKEPWDGLNANRGKEILKFSAKSAGVKMGITMKSLRAALLGQMQGPDLLSTWSLLARVGEDRNRLSSFI